MPKKHGRVVELSSRAKPSPQPKERQAEKKDESFTPGDSGLFPSPGTLRANKRIPGMARRSSRNWTQPARCEPEPEPEPEPRQDPFRHKLETRPEPEQQPEEAPSTLRPEPEPRSSPAQSDREAEPPSSPEEPANFAELMAASKELESDEDDEDPVRLCSLFSLSCSIYRWLLTFCLLYPLFSQEKVFASALIGAASEGDVSAQAICRCL